LAEPGRPSPSASLATDAGPRESRDLSHRLYRPIVFDEPDRLVDPPSWVEHIPFAFWLVEALRPQIFVELGTHSGNSYAAFAQAVQTLQLATACYAIDTWKGDPHSGEYDESVFTEWRAYHDRRFASFSRLIRASFSEALEHFSAGSVDLLHIDGYHSYDAVERDFATWLPKLSSRGIVLLHDVNVREGDFGAWRLWQQLESTYPTFAFLHGHGLGVVGVGPEVPPSVGWLFDAGRDAPDGAEVRRFFSRLGRKLSLQDEVRRREEQIGTLETQVLEERANRLQALADLELGRENRRACLGYAVNQLESQLKEAKTRHEEDVLELRTLLQEESSRRDQIILELDSEARSLAVAANAGRPGTAPPSPGSALPRRSRIRRLGTALRATLSIVPRAVASGPLRARARQLLWVLRRPRRAVDAYIVLRSGLFDARAYVARYPDISASGIDPLLHYVYCGALERRHPHPLFEPAYYLERNPDVARAGLEPFSHFLTTGAFEPRSPGPYFDTLYYLASNPDVRDAGANPLVHFVETGWREGRNPSALFDCADYLARYEDVRATGMNPVVHFAEVGAREGRAVSPPASSPVPVTPRIRLTATPLSPGRPDRPIVVCLTHVCPWPPHAGNAYRIFRLLKRLQREGYSIVPLIVPLGGEHPDEASIRKVEEVFSNIIVVDREGGIRYSVADVPDVLASLGGEHTPRYSAVLGEEQAVGGRQRERLLTDRTYCPDAAIAALLRLHSGLGKYVLLTEYVWMARVLPLIDDRAIKVIDTIDVFSTKAEKVLRFGIHDLWLEPEEEARRLRLADLVIAIQEDERDILQRLVPNTPVVTTGIDFEVAGDTRLPVEPRALYVASGNPMNVRGLTEFLRFAWPAVRQQVPEAELLVAGAVSDAITDPPAGVRLLGRVDDLDALYAGARVIINPALAGTGIKIKTIEALSRLRPIVTWPTGVDGVPSELKNLCDIVQDWYEFGPRVAARLTNGREGLSAADRKVIERATSGETVYGELTLALRDLWTSRESASASARR
jgi:hypothetical protein